MAEILLYLTEKDFPNVESDPRILLEIKKECEKNKIQLSTYNKAKFEIKLDRKNKFSKIINIEDFEQLCN